MILNDDLVRQLQAIFAAEAEEHLQAITRHMLALEQQQSPDAANRALTEIFREAHTLKGAARSVNLEPVEMLAHQLETLFSRLQRAELRPHQQLFDLVYQVLDAIGILVQGAEAGSARAVDVGDLCARLERLGQAQAEPEPTAGQERPAASEPQAEKQRRRRARSAQPAPPSQAARVVANQPPERAASSARPSDETVRIATTKLDSLMAQVGELQVTRIGVEQRRVDLRALEEQVELWETRWRKLRPSYRRIQQLCGSPTSAAEPINRAGDPAWPGKRSDLDMLLGFLETNETQLRSLRAQLGNLSKAIDADRRRLTQVAADLQDDVRRTRMLPVASVFDTFPRMVRDLARECGKDVQLKIDGAETEVDRSLLEQIKAPLMHLLRNCVDHGIETRAARRASGKPDMGTISLSATQQAGSILIEVADDGAGIDLGRVRARSVEQGLMTAEAAEAMSDREALWLIFRSGLSTRSTITDISGRGVGMDVVREHIERLNGMIDVISQPNEGTRFSLRLPLTIATTHCLLVRASGQTLALPIVNLVRMIRLAPGEIGRADGREGIHVDGRPIALGRLADVLELEAREPEQAPASRHAAIILGAAEKRIALLVDALVGTQEVVIKPLPRPLQRVHYTIGATILGTGEVVMVLNVADLMRATLHAQPRRAVPPAASAAKQGPAMVMVADDSLTTRMMEKHILEAAGYRVHVAADGMEAWHFLQANHVDLLVSDVNMPRLDGFDLAVKVRADKRLTDLPIILVTSLNSDADRARGVAVGADAYIVKSAFDQDTLLTTIRRYI